jgi:putative hydrolase of the HAD superfamily
MRILALDVDGVLLDSDRGGAGHWSGELERRHGITPTQLREAFFDRYWDDIVNGRRAIEDGLAEALEAIGTSIGCESVLSCWFEADFVPVNSAIALANRVAQSGARLVLATNQEHRRAAFLRQRLGELLPIDAVLYSADLGHQKHEPAFFEVASRRLGLSTNQGDRVVFVDDLLLNVETAAAAGWNAVLATEFADWHQTVEVLIQREPSVAGSLCSQFGPNINEFDAIARRGKFDQAF